MEEEGCWPREEDIKEEQALELGPREARPLPKPKRDFSSLSLQTRGKGHKEEGEEGTRSDEESERSNWSD